MRGGARRVPKAIPRGRLRLGRSLGVTDRSSDVTSGAATGRRIRGSASSNFTMHHPVVGQWPRFAFVLALSITAASCGGGGDDGNGQIRLVNATLDVDSIDMTVDTSDIAETRVLSSVTRDGQSEYVGLSTSTYTLRAKRSGLSSTLAVGAAGIQKDKRHTAFAYGREGDYRIATVLEDEDLPAVGNTSVRVLNAAPDAGPLDIYITESDSLLENTVPIASNVAGGALSGFNTIDSATYRLRVTGASDKEDIRLDVASLRLDSQSRVTLVIQPGVGGVLVDVLVSQYQSGISAVKNSMSRVRLIASVTASGAVTGSVGASLLNVNLRSPSVGRYKLIQAGRQTVDVLVNGIALPAAPFDMMPGADYAVAVYGDSAAPVWRVLSDDNRLPVGSDRARMRLMHLAATAAADLTLVKDYVPVVNNVSYGTVSSHALVSTATEARLEVTSTTSSVPLYLGEEVEIVGKGVYTVFLLSGSTVPTGALRRER